MNEVISQTTAERNEETKKRFESIKPLLDEGHSYRSALKKITGAKANINSLRWFKETVKYGESQGYPYKEYMWKKKHSIK